MQGRETGEVSGSDVNHNDREESKGCGKKQAFRYHARQPCLLLKTPMNSTETLAGETTWNLPGLLHCGPHFCGTPTLPPVPEQNWTHHPELPAYPPSPLLQGCFARGATTCWSPRLPALPPPLPPSSHDLWTAGPPKTEALTVSALLPASHGLAWCLARICHRNEWMTHRESSLPPPARTPPQSLCSSSFPHQTSKSRTHKRSYGIQNMASCCSLKITT